MKKKMLIKETREGRDHLLSHERFIAMCEFMHMKEEAVVATEEEAVVVEMPTIAAEEAVEFRFIKPYKTIKEREAEAEVKLPPFSFCRDMR